MTKLSFLFALRNKLSELPPDEVDEHLRFYSEMIEDRMEEGLSEEAAVEAVGSVEEIAAQINAEISPNKIAKKPAVTKRHLKTWEIVLLIIGVPVWGALLIGALAVVFSVYISWWSVIISLWAAFGAVIACAFGGILSGIVLALGGKTLIGMALIGTSLVCLGISILLFWLCKGISKATVWLTRKLLHAVRKLLFGKEMA